MHRCIAQKTVLRFISRCGQHHPHYYYDCCSRQQQNISLNVRRAFSKEYYKLRKKAKKEDPFATLGISLDPKEETTDNVTIMYAHVKKVFLIIAMKHHPDTTEAKTPEETEEHREIFIASRRAFEMIVEGPGGEAILRADEDKIWGEEELDAWFRNETGHDMPFMDAATMKEVAEMTENMGGGLDRDGGMWQLARMVTQAVNSGGDGASLLQLEAGEIRDRQINGILRRRRQR